MTYARPLVIFAVLALVADDARAMCGAMLVKQPTKPAQPTRPDDTGIVAGSARLTNHATKVVMVRDGDTTITTMSNDFDGDVVEFGLVVPVTSVVTKADVKLLEAKLFDALEAVTAPVLVEHYDPSPCPEPPSTGVAMESAAAPAPAEEKATAGGGPRASQYGVKVESHFAAGEYDVAVLSGKDSGRLIEWLRLFKYDVPAKAEAVIRSYLAQKVYFLVAHVDVRKMQREGRSFLRPLQMKTTSPKFMLPIRLGMVNADGPQELVVYALSQEGRVEPTNYRSARMPTEQHLPPAVKDRFSEVQRTVFQAETQRQDMRVVFTEWNGAALSVLDRATLVDSGVPAGGSSPRWNLARLHFLYDEAHFPEDLVLQATQDRAPFSVRHHVTHPWPGSPDACSEAKQYFAELPLRQDKEAQVLAQLTGWPLDRARREAGLPAVSAATTTTEQAPPRPVEKVPWYKRLWGD